MDYVDQFGVHLRFCQILEHEVHHYFWEVEILFLGAIIQLEQYVEGIIEENLEHILIISEHKEESL